jgi:YgiT-type zinc finger domain-containing protein
MNCPICRNGDTAPGKVTITLQRGETTVVFKEVPAEVCQNCGEFYLSEAVTEKLLNRAEESVKNGAELEILRYAA